MYIKKILDQKSESPQAKIPPKTYFSPGISKSEKEKDHKTNGLIAKWRILAYLNLNILSRHI